MLVFICEIMKITANFSFNWDVRQSMCVCVTT